MALLGKRNTAVGIDIGSRSIRAVKLQKGRNKPRLVALGSISVPKGAVSGGEIIDPGVVSESLADLFRKTGIRDREVILGVGNQRVIVRLIELPYMDPKELRSAITFQAQDFIPIPVEDAIIDYEQIGEYVNQDGERMIQLLLVAAHKGMISSFIEVVEKAGLKPIVIDVNAFAIARALMVEGETQPEAPETAEPAAPAGDLEDLVTESSEEEEKAEREGPEEEEVEPQEEEADQSEGAAEVEETDSIDEQTIEEDLETIDESFFEEDEEEGPPLINDGGTDVQETDGDSVVAIIDVGADITNLSIIEGSRVKFVRVIGIGGDDWTESIMEIMGVTFDEAEELKTRIGLPPLGGDRYVDVPGDLIDRADRVFSVLEREVVRFITEIRRSFEYYVSQTGGTPVKTLILTGGSSSLKNFRQYVRRGLEAEIITRSPFVLLEVPPVLRNQIEPEDEASYTIAIGLALRGLKND